MTDTELGSVRALARGCGVLVNATISPYFFRPYIGFLVPENQHV